MIRFSDVSVEYSNDIVALENISFILEGPTLTGIIGPNGGGKSTLLKVILKLIPYSGEVIITNNNLSKIAYVEQKSNIDFTFPITVKECVSLGTYPNLGLFKKLSQYDKENVDETLKKLRIDEYANRQISELSGGQFQRVLLARCLVQNANYILLDEPFTGIDSVSEQIIMNNLQDLKSNGKVIIIVHHDLSKVTKYFDQLIILNKKLISSGKTKDVFLKKNLIKAYGDSPFIEGAE